MLYDLNIPWSPSAAPDQLRQTLKFSASLGYNVVALNHTLNLPIPVQVENPMPKLSDIFTPRNTSSYAQSDTFMHDQFPFMTPAQLARWNALYPVGATPSFPNSGRFWRTLWPASLTRAKSRLFSSIERA